LWQLIKFVLSSGQISDISGPIAEEFARSGITEKELGEFLEREKHAMRNERLLRDEDVSPPANGYIR